MSLPSISFKEFVQNPIVALLFMCLMAIGYLYIDNRSSLTSQIETLKSEVNSLKDENRTLNNKIIEILTTLKENEK
jgi:hypothetical protein